MVGGHGEGQDDAAEHEQNTCRRQEGQRSKKTVAGSELASRLGLHVFDCLNIGSSFLDTML